MTRNQAAALTAAAILVIGTIVLLTRHHARPDAAPVAAASGLAAPTGAPPAECLLPGPPPVPPRGETASAEDMKLGHDVMQAFVEQLEAYQTCRNSQIDHAAGDVTPQQKQQWLDQGNAAVDEANALAAAFGGQLRAFKARSPGQ